jgi:RNA polymerase sigma-54 factor
MDINLTPSLKQSIQIFLSAKLLNTLKIISLPYIEMIEEIKKEASENPLIEVEREDLLASYLKYVQSHKKEKKEIDFSSYPGMKDVKAKSYDMYSFLKEQLKLTDLSDKQIEIGESLIENINQNGYLDNYKEIRKKISNKLKVSPEEIDEVLNAIHEFEPDGIAARDLKECLLLQIENYEFEDLELEELLEIIITEYIDDLAKKDFKKIADNLKIEIEDVEEVSNFIKENLNPYPGSVFQETARQVIPSFTIEIKGNELKAINLEKEYGPKINISAAYTKMLSDPKIDKETLKFLREKLDKANELVENLEKRRKTQEEIVKLILEKQKEFFEKKKKTLKALTQKEIADVIGVHPSTISRAISGKYFQTPGGVLPIKYFFARPTKGASIPELEEKIRTIVSKENKKSPLSDNQIKYELSEDGIHLKRRTITFYRAKLGIPPKEERFEKNG